MVRKLISGDFFQLKHRIFQTLRCGGPRIVVSTAAFHAIARGSFPGFFSVSAV